MDFDISDCDRGTSSASTLDEEPFCTQLIDYSAIDRLHAWRGRSRQQGRGGGRSAVGACSVNTGRGARAVVQGGGQEGFAQWCSCEVDVKRHSSIRLNSL
jgi:hypothetical protein